jgi:addiction module HigA family antidote
MSMHNPAHPGEILLELMITPMGLTVTEAAQHLNISRKTLSKVLNGRGAITPEMAVRLEIAFSNPSAEHWMNLQSAYDLWQLRAHRSICKSALFQCVNPDPAPPEGAGFLWNKRHISGVNSSATSSLSGAAPQ